MVIGLFGLLGRRFVVERIRYISAPSDYLIAFTVSDWRERRSDDIYQ